MSVLSLRKWIWLVFAESNWEHFVLLLQKAQDLASLSCYAVLRGWCHHIRLHVVQNVTSEKVKECYCITQKQKTYKGYFVKSNLMKSKLIFIYDPLSTPFIKHHSLIDFWGKAVQIYWVWSMWKEQKTPAVFVILVRFANNCLSFQLHLKINIGYIIQVGFFSPIPIITSPLWPLSVTFSNLCI